MDEILNSEIYLLSRYPKIIFYNTFIILLIIVTIIFSCNYNYINYYDSTGIVIENDNKYLFQISMPLDLVSKITANKTIEINEKLYNYKINKIDENLYHDGINTNYQNIYLEIDLKDKDKINNLLLNFKLKIGEEKLINYFKKLF